MTTDEIRPDHLEAMIAAGESVDEGLREAILAMASSSVMAEAGLTPEFAAVYAKHGHLLQNLPAKLQERIRKEFSQKADFLTYLEGIERKHSEEREKALVHWLQGVLVLTNYMGRDTPLNREQPSAAG